MIQIVSKKHKVTHELKETDMTSTNKGAGTYNSKKESCMRGKKDLEEPLTRKTSLGKTCSLFRQECSGADKHVDPANDLSLMHVSKWQPKTMKETKAR